MNAIGLLGRVAPGAVVLALVLAALAGACYAMLIPLVLASTERFLGLEYEVQQATVVLGLQVSTPRLALAFAVLCAAIFSMRTASELILTWVSTTLTREMREQLYYAIVRCPIRVLERLGSPKIITTLTTDVLRIVNGASATPPIIVGAVTVVGMLLYVWIIKAEVFYVVIAALLIGGGSFQAVSLLSGRYFTAARQSMDQLQASVQALVLGAKELRLSKAKCDSFIDASLLEVEVQLQHTNLRAHAVSTVAINYADMLGFMVVGGLAFILVNYYPLSTQQLVAAIMVVLYIAGPVAEILARTPVLIQANVSHQKMNALLAEMTDEQSGASDPAPPWKELRFRNITYAYDKPGGFSIGPIDLTIRRGEITFVIGGNGSGKSTFSKIATLHYQPSSGELCFDDVRVDRSNLGRYRQRIACIYSDYHLFTALHGVQGSDAEVKKKTDLLLHQFGLSGKVTFENGRFSTLDLSDGQRRRLALVVAILEDKDFYLFDEWAADQDSIYREAYYTKVLPALKAQGKAVLAISHDDRYFHLADRLVKFEEGLVTGVDGAQFQQLHSRAASADASMVH